MAENPTHYKSGLMWWPSEGRGYYPVRRPIYDGEYFKKYVGYSKTDMGRALTEARVKLVNRYVEQKEPVIDIGIGCGHFVENRQPGTFGYDVNPDGIRWLLRNDLWWDPYQTPPRVVTMWDSLEHMPFPEDLLKRVSFAFVAIPIFKGPEHCQESKHFRKDEHYHYFTHEGFIAWMEKLSFQLVEHNTVEEKIGREDVGTYVFKKPWGSA